MIAAGRAADWASHRIEHEISAIYDITHGAGYGNSISSMDGICKR